MIFNLLFSELKNIDSFQSYESLKLSNENAPKYAWIQTANFRHLTVYFYYSNSNFDNFGRNQIFQFWKKQIKDHFL